MCNIGNVLLLYNINLKEGNYFLLLEAAGNTPVNIRLKNFQLLRKNSASGCRF